MKLIGKGVDIVKSKYCLASGACEVVCIELMIAWRQSTRLPLPP